MPFAHAWCAYKHEHLASSSYQSYYDNLMNMFCYFVILLLAISSKAASQCDYIYVAEPPNGQLILCDPFAIDQLRLVCSIYVDNFSQNDVLRIQWFFSAPINFQFNPTNAQLLREVSFDVTTSETFTSRIVVSDIKD